MTPAPRGIIVACANPPMTYSGCKACWIIPTPLPGPHLRSIVTEKRRLGADGVVAELGAMRIAALATTTSAGEPRVSPIDGLFYRGHFYFGSGVDSFRFKHIRARPAVSLSVIEGERLQVTVHGRAYPVDPGREPELESFLVSVYGHAAWDDWMRRMPWARIEAERMIAMRTSAQPA